MAPGSTGSRSRAAGVVRGALWALAAGHVAEAAVLRRRARGIAALPATVDQTVPVEGVTVIGLPVDPATLAAVAAELATSQVEVIDLVPGDLPAARALRLLRRVDPGRLLDDPLHTPGGAHEGLAVRTTLAARIGVEAGGHRGPRSPGPAGKATLPAQP